MLIFYYGKSSPPVQCIILCRLKADSTVPRLRLSFSGAKNCRFFIHRFYWQDICTNECVLFSMKGVGIKLKMLGARVKRVKGFSALSEDSPLSTAKRLNGSKMNGFSIQRSVQNHLGAQIKYSIWTPAESKKSLLDPLDISYIQRTIVDQIHMLLLGYL